MLGFDWTRTKDCTRRAMAESDWGSRISSQGMEAASAMPVVISTRRSASCSRTANQMAWVFMVGGQDLGIKLLAPLLHPRFDLFDLHLLDRFRPRQVVFHVPAKLLLLLGREGEFDLGLGLQPPDQDA